MITNETKLRVRYSETDKMGVVYNGNYAQYYEVGRVELLRNLGMTYRQMEEEGTMLPVMRLECNYLRPAKYDDELTIRTFVKEFPKTRMEFHHEIYNEEGIVINRGNVTLVFVDIKTNRPRRAPASLVDLIKRFWKE